MNEITCHLGDNGTCAWRNVDSPAVGLAFLFTIEFHRLILCSLREGTCLFSDLIFLGVLTGFRCGVAGCFRADRCRGAIIFIIGTRYDAVLVMLAVVLAVIPYCDMCSARKTNSRMNNHSNINYIC